MVPWTFQPTSPPMAPSPLPLYTKDTSLSIEEPCICALDHHPFTPANPPAFTLPPATVSTTLPFTLQSFIIDAPVWLCPVIAPNLASAPLTVNAPPSITQFWIVPVFIAANAPAAPDTCFTVTSLKVKFLMIPLLVINKPASFPVASIVRPEIVLPLPSNAPLNSVTGTHASLVDISRSASNVITVATFVITVGSLAKFINPSSFLTKYLPASVSSYPKSATSINDIPYRFPATYLYSSPATTDSAL